MSRTYHDGSRRIRVRGIRRKEPELRKLAAALLDIAQAQLEAEAERDHKRSQQPDNVVDLRPKKRRGDAGSEKDAA